MNMKKIGFGVLLWSLGTLLPVAQHAILMGLSVESLKGKDQFYNFPQVVSHFFGLPWLVWIYVAVMWLLGTVLVVSGVKDTT